jgi:dTDP-4-amino-4,6-dideoxygalactose transaminase
MMKVRFFDLSVHDVELKSKLLQAVDSVLSSGVILLGPEVEKLERNVAEFNNANFAVGVASGSSALYLALKAAGIKPGDEVITSPLGWIITANAIYETGATPVFADVGDDLNISPKAIEHSITKKTKAIVPVHFMGLLCDMDSIEKIAKSNNLKIIEDAAQAFGANRNGRYAGSWSEVSAFSMNPMKVFGGFGEAGAVVCKDEAAWDYIRLLRYAGTTSDPAKIITNHCITPSLNHKIDALNAAMLNVMFNELPNKMKKRFEIANFYNQELNNIVNCPPLRANETHSLYSYAIRAQNRDDLNTYLNANGIETKIYHKPLFTEAPAYRNTASTNLPNAKKIMGEVLSLPAHEKLKEEEIEYIVRKVKSFYS